ncbi:MAG: hypothetical protein ACR2IK_19990 [Chloroflexota bacterium]
MCRTIWPHQSMAEQVWVHGCRLTDPTVTRRAQGQHPDIGSLGGGLDELPGADAVNRLPPATAITLAREEEGLIVVENALACPKE